VNSSTVRLTSVFDPLCKICKAAFILYFISYFPFANHFSESYQIVPYYQNHQIRALSDLNSILVQNSELDRIIAHRKT